MAETVSPLQAFNRGLISKLGLARTDLKRQALSAEVMTNWMPRVLGSMMLRPGLGYIANTLNNNQAKHLPFVFATDDTAIIELTGNGTTGLMRVYVNEAIVTRAAVSTTLTNGTFLTDLTGWTSADESGATSSWGGAGIMKLVGTGFNAAKRYQELTIADADQKVEHALTIVVSLETVTLRVGSSSGTDDLIEQTTLAVGTHSLAFTPTGSAVYVEFSNANNYAGYVNSVAIAPAGELQIATPWATSDLPLLRYDQSADVIFIACDGHQQRKIERRSLTSWSLVLYQPADGPFLLENIGPIQMTPSATTGAITLTASKPFFKSGHVGALFKLASVGQHVNVAAGGTNQWSAAIELTGLTADRNIAISITGTFSGTVILQRSVGAVGAWEDVSGQSWTGPVATSFNDSLDNQIIYYRIGIESTYTSGTATCVLDSSAGSITGVVRVNAYTDTTHVSATVLTQTNSTGVLQGLGSTNATSEWWEGQWSSVQGYPTSVSFYQGRLWWFGRGAVVGSASDAFDSFDDTITGDSQPINRNIGSGPVDIINWGLPLQRLLIGSQGKEISVRSDSLDDPITNANFNLKDASTQGSASCAAVKIDNNGVFVDRSTRRVYQLNFNWTLDGVDYSSSDLTNFVPDISIPHGGISMIAVQRKPDTRIHALMADGTVAVMIYDLEEEEHAWVMVETAGLVEDVVVLPGVFEDRVYYAVKRTINGQTVRFFERWAREDECWGDPTGKVADAFTYYSGAPVTSVTAPQLPNTQVVVWGWNTITPFVDGYGNTVGRDFGTFTTDSNGTMTGLSAYCTDVVVGLAYTAQFQSAKLAYGARLGTALTQSKRLIRLGIIAANMHAKGLQYGPDFDTLDDLPGAEEGKTVDPNTVWPEYDMRSKPFPGKWDSDSRLCLVGNAPRPVTLLAAIVETDTREKA